MTPNSAQGSKTTADTATTSAKIGFSDGWPNWAKPVFALAVAAIWIGMPLVAAWSLSARTVQAGGVVDYQPVLVVLVGMTTATITGIFVFMTFRIDRGTRLKVEEVTGKALKDEKKKLDKATKNAEDAVKNANCKIDKEIEKKLSAEISPEKIRKKVEEHVSEEKVREHVKAMLMTDAIVQAVAASAQEQAKSLDPDTILRISEHLKETADAWAPRIEDKERTGWWFFGRWGRSRRNG